MERYIEAEALKKHFPHDEDWDCPVNTNSLVCELIDAQPVADVEPVRHGKWEMYGAITRGTLAIPIYRCSECKEDTNNWFWHYCPNCGAKMDEEAQP